MKTLRNLNLVMLLLAVVLMAGCKKDENNGNNENTETVGHKNPNPAQDTPLSEHFLPEFESVYQLYPNSDGSFYALAYGEYTDYLLKLDNSGYVQQRTELGFRSCRCITKSGENIVVIGNLGKTSSPYTMYEQGYIAVYDHNMQLVATTILKESQYKITIYTLLQDVQDPTLFYAGGAAIDESYIQYPYLCTLQFSDGLMTKVSSKVYTDYAKYRIIGMVEKQLAGQKDLILETHHYKVLDQPNNTDRGEIHIIKTNYFEEESGWGNETWDVAITGPHGDSYAGNNSIDSDENNVYFFGQCCDDKEPAPSDDGYWDSGCVAAINWHNGQMVWRKRIPLTNKDEHFFNGLLSDGYLYACGSHSGVHYYSTKKTFVNGLVAKISLSGELVAYKTFGDPERYSCFIHLAKDSNGSVICVGYSGENLGDDQTKWSAWFLKTDLSSGGLSKATPADTKDGGFEDLDAESTGVPMEDDRHGGGI